MRVAISAVLALAVGCQGSSTSAPAAGQATVRRYTVRGAIERLPDPKGPIREMMLHHEAIDDFVDTSGQVVGMDSMVMPFPVAASVSLDGLAVGDEVEVVFAIDWSRSSFQVERLGKLPKGTPLQFGKAHPGPARSP